MIVRRGVAATLTCEQVARGCAGNETGDGVAMERPRHSTIMFAMDRYAHLGMETVGMRRWTADRRSPPHARQSNGINVEETASQTPTGNDACLIVKNCVANCGEPHAA